MVSMISEDPARVKGGFVKYIVHKFCGFLSPNRVATYLFNRLAVAKYLPMTIFARDLQEREKKSSLLIQYSNFFMLLHAK